MGRGAGDTHPSPEMGRAPGPSHFSRLGFWQYSIPVAALSLPRGPDLCCQLCFRCSSPAGPVPPRISKAWHAHYRCQYWGPSFLVKVCCSPSPATHPTPPGARAPRTIQRHQLLPSPRRCHARMCPQPPALGGGSIRRLLTRGAQCPPHPPPSVEAIHSTLSEIPRARVSDCRAATLGVQHWPARHPPPAAPLDRGPSSGPSFSPLPSQGGSGGSWKGRDEVILSLGVSWWRRGCGRRERARGEERNV